ncbi:MAG: formylglycine-generating enzyme family protein [Rhodospirillales bacterium]|nr:formylglycine-generating enzyme family protein [Rhodospirillales bacterium]
MSPLRAGFIAALAMAVLLAGSLWTTSFAAESKTKRLLLNATTAQPSGPDAPPLPSLPFESTATAPKVPVVPAPSIATNKSDKAKKPDPAPGEDTPLKPGQVFKDCPECPELVVIPAGIFIMGLNGKKKSQKPAHRVNITKPFAMGRFEIKFSEWLACADDGGCQHRPDDHKWGRKGRPVINVTYFDAMEYLSWISKKTGQVYRLPSEAEWEYADRGGSTSLWWWGDKVGKNHANCKDCKSKWSDGGTEPHGSAPVGSFKANPFGLYDTAANVFEWVQDCWNKTHKGAPTDASARMQGNCRYRVIRGGSFYYYSKVAKAAYRAKNPPGVKSYWLGFRVLREIK